MEHRGMTFLVRNHVCPWWLAYSFDNPLRRLFHNPEKILRPFVREGMRVVDIGCGMGFFSLAMARMVGEAGSVVSVDLQPKMIEVLERRARKVGLEGRIHAHLCGQDRIEVDGPFDFALTFWMVHEVPNSRGFLGEIYSLLSSEGRYLIAEPKGHTSVEDFRKTLETAREVGFKEIEAPRVSLSRAVVLERG